MEIPIIRMVKPEDTASILDIYAPYIRHTHSSFEYTVPPLSSFQERINENIQTHPWLVCEWEGEVAGYAYASPHRAREAYQWTAESSVYVHERFRRKGIAHALYQSLLSILEWQGVVNVFAIIALPNEASIAFHKRLGFFQIGKLKQVGFKAGDWIDTSWWHYIIRERPQGATPPIWVRDLDQNHPIWKKAMDSFPSEGKKS